MAVKRANVIVSSNYRFPIEWEGDDAEDLHKAVAELWSKHTGGACSGAQFVALQLQIEDFLPPEEESGPELEIIK